MRVGVPAFVVLLGLGCSGPHVVAGDPHAPVMPVASSPRAAVAIAAGRYFTCARLADRHVRCWGEVPFSRNLAP